MNYKWDEALEKATIKLENYGNSIALYILLVSILFSAWQLTPLPGIEWSPNARAFGFIALIFVLFSALHGVFWWVLTREFLPLSSKIQRFLSTMIRIVRPLHMMTGMLGLGFVLMHGLSYITGSSLQWNITTISGFISSGLLLLLALDGVGLMMSPFLSRTVHRWIAAIFLISTSVHFWIVFS